MINTSEISLFVKNPRAPFVVVNVTFQNRNFHFLIFVELAISKLLLSGHTQKYMDGCPNLPSETTTTTHFVSCAMCRLRCHAEILHSATRGRSSSCIQPDAFVTALRSRRLFLPRSYKCNTH
jgi:hypothetical protein